jgi:hypothetical protein
MAEAVVPVFSDAPGGRAVGCAETISFVFACGALVGLWDARSPSFRACRSSFCETIATLSAGFGAGLTNSSSSA